MIVNKSGPKTVSMAKVSTYHALLIALVCIVSEVQAANPLSCLDEGGNAVDWYIAYKFPMINGEKNFETGYVYSYITSKDVEDEMGTFQNIKDPESVLFLEKFRGLLGGFPSPRILRQSSKRRKLTKSESVPKNSKWIASKLLLADSRSAILRTLAPAYSDMEISSVFYNDDPSGTDTSSSSFEKERFKANVAHAKGVLLMDDQDNAVWLSHTVPRFPNIRSKNLEYPEYAKLHGQTFMCATLDFTKSGSQMINHLVNMRPNIYESKISKTLLKKYPNLVMLDTYDNTKGRRWPSQPKLTQSITTKGNQALQLFSKSGLFDQDIYAGYIDEEINSDLYVATWRAGSGGVLPSSCPSKDYHVNNVQDLRYSDSVVWPFTKDHSKWAISDGEDVATVCLGDSNRMRSQFKRGGGAVCIKCPTCWSIFNNSVLDTEPCPIGAAKSKRRSESIDRSLVEDIKKVFDM